MLALVACVPPAGDAGPAKSGAVAVTFYPTTPAPTPTVAASRTPVVTESNPEAPSEAATPEPEPSPLPTQENPAESDTFVPECDPAGEYTRCRDSVLGIQFEYPAEWGSVTGTTWSGYDAGFKYVYQFSMAGYRYQQAILRVAAGGTGNAYSEPRSRFFTDFEGFGSDFGDEKCASYEVSVCDVFNEHLVVKLSFPQAEIVCDPGPGVIYDPIMRILVDLPGNPRIQGFVFVSEFVSASMSQELRSIISLPDPPEQCETGGARFDAKVQEIIRRVAAGDLDDETAANLRKLRHLAESIQFLR